MLALFHPIACYFSIYMVIRYCNEDCKILSNRKPQFCFINTSIGGINIRFFLKLILKTTDIYYAGIDFKCFFLYFSALIYLTSKSGIPVFLFFHIFFQTAYSIFTILERKNTFYHSQKVILRRNLQTFSKTKNELLQGLKEVVK